MSYTIPGERMYSIADSLRDEGIEIGRREGHDEGLEQGLEQGLEKGRVQGLEQGREQGMEQGRVVESRRVLLRLLAKRFDLTDDDRALIAHCSDIEELEAAAELLVEPEATKDAVIELLRNR